MLREIGPTNLKRAVRHPANFRPIIFCTLSLLAIGIVMVIIGVTIVLIDSMELGPAQFDAHYERYQGSSLAHIIGPMFIAFGSLVTAGNVCMLAYTTARYYSLRTRQEIDGRY